MHRETGFTLIELMTVLAVSAISLSIAIPAFSSFTDNARQAGAVNDLVGSMHIARSTAVTTNTRVTVCASKDGTDCDNSDWNDGWIVFADLDSDQKLDAGETILNASGSTDGLTIQSVQLDDWFMFRPNGRVMKNTVTGNSGDFVVCDDRGSEFGKVVIVDLSGRPRLSHYHADGSPPACP